MSCRCHNLSQGYRYDRDVYSIKAYEHCLVVMSLKDEEGDEAAFALCTCDV